MMLSPRDRDFVLQATNAVNEIERRKSRNLIYKMYPAEDNLDDLDETGAPIYYARRRYKRHMEFFKAGAQYRERCIMAANRVGKTYGIGGYELSLHLTGEYPSWWRGRRFSRPVKAWAAGKTNETTRDIIQTTLMGELVKDAVGRRGFDGTGLLPWGRVTSMAFKRGIDLLDTARIRHVSGGHSTLGFKSYEQGRGSFEGTAQHVIWFDEEPPLDIYSEAIIRTATTNGILMLSFTPLEGMSETVMLYMPDSMKPGA